MNSKFESAGSAEWTEFSLGLGMLVAMGIALGSIAIRHAEPQLGRRVVHIAQAIGDTVI